VIQKTSLLLLLFLCASCAIKSRQDQDKIRAYYKQKQFQEALTFLDTSDLKKKKENTLLYLMEKGKLLYKLKKFERSSAIFLKANELVDKLYTKSIRETIASGLLSDNSKSYYGSVFERSMLYYYQAMSYLKLSESSSVYAEKRKYLFKSRASLLAWDSFFQEINRKSGLKTLYRGSLIGKTLAGLVHERIGGSTERSIALQLYKDAAKILKTQGLTYRSFNLRNTSYITSIKDKKKKKEISKEVNKTSRYKDLKDYIDFKILSLTRQIRNYDFKKMVKRYKPSKSVIAEAKKKHNVSILVEDGLVSPMRAKVQSYTLASAIDSIKNPTTRDLVRAIGLPVITYFAMGPLGLGVPARSGNYVFFNSHNVGTSITQEAGIEFEMPAVDIADDKVEISKTLQVYSEDGKQKILEKSLTLFGALSDVAFLQANERASNSYKKVGAKIAIKHLVAIIAAFQTYNQMKKNGAEIFAKPAAFGQYVLSAKAISASEKADVRHWTTLPDAVRTTDLNLKPGKYKLLLKNTKGKESTISDLGLISVSSETRQVFSFSLN
jgi:hypothetical protein